MKSRMDKYYKDEDVMQRTSKNDSLYEELYKQKQVPRSNITVIENVNEIDITKIKSMVDSREKYKRVRDYEKIVGGVDNYKTSEIKYDFEEIIVLLSNQKLYIQGKCLNIDYFNEDELLIKGRVQSIRFHNRA